MAIPRTSGPYTGPKFSIRKVAGEYQGPKFAVTPGGVPAQEYPVYGAASDNSNGGPPAPAPPPVNLPVYKSAPPVEPPSEPDYVPPFNAEEAADRNLTNLLNTPAVDKNGRVKSALYGLGAPVAPSNSLGVVIGERLANLANYAINPKLDEEDARAQEIQRQLAIRKIQDEQAQTEADIDYRRAAAANQANLPVSANKQVKVVQDAETGSWYTVTSDKKTGASTSSTVSSPDGTGQLTTTSPQAMTAEQKQKDRDLRASLTRLHVAPADDIAALALGVQQEKSDLEKQNKSDAFKAKYPHYGETLTTDQLIEKQRRLKAAGAPMLMEDIIKDAVGQGYVIKN